MNRSLIALTILLAALGSACVSKSPLAGDSEIDPVKVIKTKNSDIKRLALTEQAADRLDIKSVKVGANVVPYAALLYTADGKTWVFTRPAPLEFVRSEVVVSEIRGEQALLKRGPPAGTAVVTTGAAELLGAESGVGEE